MESEAVAVGWEGRGWGEVGRLEESDENRERGEIPRPPQGLPGLYQIFRMGELTHVERAASGGHFLVAARGLLIVMASLVAEHWL